MKDIMVLRYQSEEEFFPQEWFQKQRDTFLNPFIQASLSTNKQPHNQYDELLCFARRERGRETNF